MLQINLILVPIERSCRELSIETRIKLLRAVLAKSFSILEQTNFGVLENFGVAENFGGAENFRRRRNFWRFRNFGAVPKKFGRIFGDRSIHSYVGGRNGDES